MGVKASAATYLLMLKLLHIQFEHTIRGNSPPTLTSLHAGRAKCNGQGKRNTAVPAAHGARADSGRAHALQHACAARAAQAQPQQLTGALPPEQSLTSYVDATA